MRFTISVLPDNREDLIKMNLTGLLTSFKEAEYIYNKQKEGNKPS